MIGQKLGHYRVLEKIGSGGMGEVYRAYDEQLDRDVAVKVLPPGTLADETVRKRFRKEALALAKLNHPNIETVHEFDTQDGVDFLVMEMIPGQTLAQKLKSGPLANPEILRLGLQVADGLAAAHAQGMVHRDLKPGNLIVMPDGRLKILDFGLARLLRPVEGVDATQSVTETQAISGTLPYMSPEQLRGDPIDARSDIYSAGAVLYEMATGQRPFPELHAPRLIDSILHQTPLPPSKANLRVPPTLESIILKALDKEPAHRYQSARELHAVLEALATGVVPIASRQRLLALAGASALALFILLGVSLGLNVGRLRDRLTGRLNPSKGGFASSSVPVQTRRSVAVLGFKNVSGRPDAAWLSTGLSEMFTTELGAGEKLRTIPEENVARAKMDLLLSDADSLAKDTLTRVRKNLGTDFVVLGSYVDLGKEAGGQIRVDLRLQDARDGETIATVSVMGTENQLFDLVSKAGSQLREKLGLGAISEAEASGVRASLPSDPEAARLYAEGLAKLRVFDALAARELLQKAVAADPNYALAHSALAAAWSALGYDGKSVEEARKAFDLSANLSREDRLAIEGRYREATKDWLKAIDVYHTLWTFFPDNLDYGLRLVAAQTSAGQAKDALATIEALHKLAPPASDDARIDLAVEAAARGLSDFRRELSAASNAAAKGAAQSARLLVARAKLAEGRAYFSLGEMKKSQAASEEAKRIFAEAGDRSGEATALHNIASVLSDEGDNAGAKRLEGEVLATCRKIGNKRCMADALNSIGIILKDTADFPTAQRTYEQSLALRREIGDRNGEAVSLNNIAVLLYEQGKLAAAKNMYEQSLEISREIGEKRGIVRALTNLSIVLQDQGDLAGARKMQEESLAIRREIADKVGVAIALNNLAVLLLYQGDIAGAKQRDDEQLAIEHETGKQRGLAYALFVQAEILAVQGHLAEARKAHEEALAIRSRLGERSTAAESRLSLAILSIEEDRPAEAEQPARDIRDQSRKEREPETEILAEVVLARSLLAQGKLTEAEKEINYAESASSRGENRRQQLAVAITAAHVHAATGNSAEAAKNLQITLAQSTRLGFVPYQFEARLALGEMEMKFGKTPAGRARLRALEKDATAKGFFLIARKAHAAASSQ